MPTSSQQRLTIKPIAFALLLAFPLDVWSAAGKALFVTGEVQLVHQGQAVMKLTRGSEINPGDVISTGVNGFTQIVMDDGGRLTLRANSQLKINEFNYSGKKDGSERSLMSLFTGSMRAVTGWIGHSNRDNYKVNTPTATIGIRGSDGNIGYSPEIGSSVQTLEGGHTLTSIDSNGVSRTLELRPGDVGLLRPNAPAPVKVDSFPFSTTQPPNVQANNAVTKQETAPEKEARDLQRPVVEAPVEIATTSSSTETTTTSNTAPPINDTSGGIIGNNTDGLPVVVIPQPPAPVQIATGLSPKMQAVITGESFRPQATGNYGQTRTDNHAGAAAEILTDANGNFYKFHFNNDNNESGYTYLQNGTPNAKLTSGTATIGSWTGTATANTEILRQRTSTNAGNIAWATAQAGYYQYDPLSPGPFPLTGTTTYTGASLGGHSYDQLNSVTLNSATLSADFSTQTVGLALNLNAGTAQWTATTATPVSLMALGGQVYQNSFHADTYNNSLSVSNNLGLQTPINGRIDGSFTGANFDGALLQYNFSQSNPNALNNKGQEGVAGIIGYTADTLVEGLAIVNGPSQVDTVAVSETSQIGPGGLLGTNITSSGWSYTQSDRQTFNLSHIGGTNTSNTPWTNGINSGSWSGGQIETTEHHFLDTLGSLAWGTIERPQAWYLSSLLTGTANYTLSQVTTPQGTDGNAWSVVTADTSLMVDFTNQKVNAKVGINNGQDTIIASTTNAPLKDPDGSFSASFNQNNNNGGLLTITRNGTTLTSQYANGQINGQLGGTGLEDAIMGYALFFKCLTACRSDNTAVSGMLAFKGTAQNEAVPFTVVDVASTIVNGKSSSIIGFNNASQFNSDAQGTSGFNLFADDNGAARLLRGAATNLENGSNATTGLSWGRWSGTADAVERGTGTVVGQAENVHFISSQETGPALLPLSGTFNYVKIGNTTPTNQSGVTGTLDAASLTADFTARQVNVGITATVAGTTLTGTANNLNLFDNAFHANSNGGGTGTINVSCTGSCGAQNTGSITGHFTGNGAVGAGVSYSLQSGSTINGVVGFQRVGP